MKIIKPSIEIIPQYDMLKHIEIAGRTCYKSEDKITNDSANKFVKMLIKRKHGAMLEHGTVYLIYHWSGAVCQECNEIHSDKIYDFYASNDYSDIARDGNTLYITTNYRVIIENDRLLDLMYSVEKPSERHIKRVSVRFICDRGISHELVRHRVFSFAQESTRYVDYNSDANECTFIIPSWIENDQNKLYNYLTLYVNHDLPDEATRRWVEAIEDAESFYKKLRNLGWTPQKARSVLPNSLKTEIVVTGTIPQWNEFFKLRVDKAAHPQMRELAIPLYTEFKNIYGDSVDNFIIGK